MCQTREFTPNLCKDLLDAQCIGSNCFLLFHLFLFLVFLTWLKKSIHYGLMLYHLVSFCLCLSVVVWNESVPDAMGRAYGECEVYKKHCCKSPWKRVILQGRKAVSPHSSSTRLCTLSTSAILKPKDFTTSMVLTSGRDSTTQVVLAPDVPSRCRKQVLVEHCRRGPNRKSGGAPSCQWGGSRGPEMANTLMDMYVIPGGQLMGTLWNNYGCELSSCLVRDVSATGKGKIQ